MRLHALVEIESGTPQFRIKESLSKTAQTYSFYGQTNLEGDLAGISTPAEAGKQVRTEDNVTTLHAGDLVFSLISGKAAIVNAEHSGYLLTQNYIRLNPSEMVDAKYLAYLLNEDADIKRQLTLGQQGSSVMKFTVKQLSELEFSTLPSLEKQALIGNLYFNGLKLESLKKQRASLETLLLKEMIKKAVQL